MTRTSSPAGAVSSTHTPTHVVPALNDKWKLERLLGSGSQGHVWLARHRNIATRTVAVKLLKSCADAWREVKAYSQLQLFEPHPHVLDVAFGFRDGCAIAQPCVS